MLIIYVFETSTISRNLLTLTVFIIIYSLIVLEHNEFINSQNNKSSNKKVILNSLYIQNNFIKESFYIDFLQKKFIDNFFYKTCITVFQLYSISIWTTLTTKYIYKFLLTSTSNFYHNFNNNLSFIVISVLYYFILSFNLLLLVNILI